MKELRLWDDNSLLRPWRDLLSLQRSMDRVWDDAFGSGSGRFAPMDSPVPGFDVEETDGHYVLSMDMPGIAKDDIHIEVRGDQLFVSGERRHGRKSADGAHRRIERVFTLPADIDVNQIEASCENGVLTLALAKAEAAKPRRIAISDGKPSFLSRLVGGGEKAEKRENEKAEKRENEVA